MLEEFWDLSCLRHEPCCPLFCPQIARFLVSFCVALQESLKIWFKTFRLPLTPLIDVSTPDLLGEVLWIGLFPLTAGLGQVPQHELSLFTFENKSLLSLTHTINELIPFHSSSNFSPDISCSYFLFSSQITPMLTNLSIILFLVCLFLVHENISLF